MKLYEITEEMKELQALVDSEELTAEMVADTMEAMQCEFNEKAVACLKVRQNLLADVADIDREVERLTALKKSPLNGIDRITDYLKRNMTETGQDKLDLGVFRVTLKKPTKQLGMIDETKVPADYWTVIPESKKLDKRKLLADAKENHFDFVELVDSSRALIIR